MSRFKIQHVTKYTYESPVRDSANQIILYAIKDEYQEVLKHELKISNDPVVEIYKDYYGNEVGSFATPEPHFELIIDSRIEVITRPRDQPDDARSKEEQWDNLQHVSNKVTMIDFLKVEQFDALAEITSILDLAKNHEETPYRAALRLTEYVFQNFSYIKGITNVETTLNEIWKLKAGVCQDFAHILSAMLRIINIPARYVSGYVCPNKSGMRGEGATHAWVEAFIPFYGWLGLDPTNNCIVKDLHVRLAVGRNFTDCSPVRGTYKGTSEQTLEVGVTVSYEDGNTKEDFTTILTQQPKVNEVPNSYRKFLEMQQQQQ